MERVQHRPMDILIHQEKNIMLPLSGGREAQRCDRTQAGTIGYENGVLGGVISALNVMCSKGDNVLLHSPTYIGFTMSLENNGYHIVHSPLVKDENGSLAHGF